jgi:hypothetical protein
MTAPQDLQQFDFHDCAGDMRACPGPAPGASVKQLLGGLPRGRDLNCRQVGKSDKIESPTGALYVHLLLEQLLPRDSRGCHIP